MEHLAPYLSDYLPFKLKGNYNIYTNKNKTDLFYFQTETLTGLNFKDKKIFLTSGCVTEKEDFVPYLRPLSYLTKEIEVNGERFYPLEKLTEIFGGRPISFDGNCFYTKIQKSVVRKKEDLVPLHFSQLDAFNKLFEWHFDVYGLIE
jgi:uncharacterized protein YprB with RNaseH-like and TPR domain